MLKIAYVGQKGVLNPQGGGVETHVENLSVMMAKKGHEVFLYTRPHYTSKDKKDYHGVKLVSTPSLHTKNLDAISHTFFSIFDAVFSKKVDIIHFHGVGPSIISFLPKILSSKVRVISTAHSQDWEHGKWSFFAKNMLKFGAFMSAKVADRVITVSRELQNRFLIRYKKGITLIPNGVNVTNEKIGIDLLEKFELERNKYFLAVSRIVKHKGIHYLIEAFCDMKDRRPDFADYKLVIVGQTSFTDSYFEFLKKMIGDRKDIIFTGAQRGEALKQIFAGSFLYVSPSMSEGLSVSLLEAMSFGKVPLVSDIPANLEVVGGNVDLGSVGLVFQNKNIKDLSQKMEIVIDNPDVLKRLGQKSKKYVDIYYNWVDITDRTEDIYNSVVKTNQKDKKQTAVKVALAS
jgi:glycosyltransferase involved in cell wall biosynthesis